MSSGATNVTPVGAGIGVGSGRRNGAPPLSISHRTSMALSSCTVLWQCSMNIPPQSRNCNVIVTLPAGRRRYTSLRPFSQAGTFEALPFRARIWPSSKWMWIGWPQPPPPFCSVQTSRVPYPGAAEMRPQLAFNIFPLSVCTPHGPGWPPAPVVNAAGSSGRIEDRDEIRAAVKQVPEAHGCARYQLRVDLPVVLGGHAGRGGGGGRCGGVRWTQRLGAPWSRLGRGRLARNRPRVRATER